MAQWLNDWLAAASLAELTLAFLAENLILLAGVVGAGWGLTALFSHRRVAFVPGPVTFSDGAMALVNVALNYTLVWDRLFGTVRPDYAESFGRSRIGRNVEPCASRGAPRQALHNRRGLIMKKLGLLSLFILALNLCSSLDVLQVAGSTFPLDKGESLALVGARIYTSPSEKPLINGTVLLRDGRIVAVGGRGEIKIQPRTRVIDCTGLTLTAGFWNSHVHFTEIKWENAASLPSQQLTKQLQEMLTRYGFTTVFDTGSYWEITKALRQRIESGAVEGPRIFSTGEILFPKRGAPPPELLKASGTIARTMPEVENAQQAVELVRQKLDSGVDAIKIYAQTFWDPNLKMPLEVIKAITIEAHSHARLVFVHPSNSYGLEAAIDSGADILVHTTPQTAQWDEALIAKMKRGGIALVPTLKLWRIEGERGGARPDAVQRFLDRGVYQLRAYFQAGGQILFGTDVGYITDYDPTEEYQQMERAGMRFQDILASLTTSPAGRFGASGRTGRIAPGMDADIVLLAGDPANDIKALSNVRYTIRKGKIIYQAK